LHLIKTDTHESKQRVSNNAIQLLRSINVKLGIEPKGKSRTVKSPQSNDDQASCDLEETNTVVENDCEDEFNMVDSQEENANCLQSLDGLMSPISETKANLASIDVPLMKIRIRSPNSFSSESDQAIASKHASPFPSRENSLVLSSRIESTTNGPASGLYKAESESNSSNSQ
jgi:hypothetical protein